jgi:hypothetical protein
MKGKPFEVLTSTLNETNHYGIEVIQIVLTLKLICYLQGNELIWHGTLLSLYEIYEMLGSKFLVSILG